MTKDRGYTARNDTERARLQSLVATCTDADLARQMPAGWTVAGVLEHMAFWDQRILVLLEQWQSTGVAPRPEIHADVDWINDAAKPMLLAVPVRAAAELAVAIAEAVDARVAALPDDLVDGDIAAGTLNLSRADHRGEHLDQIERVLRTGGSAGSSTDW